MILWQEAGPLEEKGMVMAVLDKSFDVFILRLGVTKRVYCEVSEYCLVYSLFVGWLLNVPATC